MRTHKRKVSVLGGSFDPPTYAHFQTAFESVNVGGMEEVWIVPCGTRKDKQMNVDGQSRLHMVQLGIQEWAPPDFPIRVDDTEIKNGEALETYHLMSMFENNDEYKDIDFYFIIGSDLVPALSKWGHGEKLVKEIKFLIFERHGYPIDKDLLPVHYIIVQSTVSFSISSTIVRARIKNHCSKYHQHDQNSSPPDQVHGIVSVSDKELDKIESIEKDGKLKFKRTLSKLDFEEKYLGVTGLIPSLVIKFIKQNNFYCNK